MPLNDFLQRFLSVRSAVSKDLLPPGNRSGVTASEPDGHAIAVTGRTDVLDFYFVQPDGRSITVPITRESAVRIAWWIVWHYFVLELWLGLRARLWSWLLRRKLSQKAPSDAAA